MTVILDAGESRKVFSVRNLGKEPILLATELADINSEIRMSQNVIVSPPITRIEPLQSQQINFILKNGVTIAQEVLLKVAFQSVGEAKKNTTRMPIRQEVAMLIVPADMNVSQSPWDALRLKQQGNQLTLSNTGRQVIRLSRTFTALPGNEIYNLEQFYLRPGESKSVTTRQNVNEIKISPLSRYGFKMQNEPVIRVTP
ncbi:P pilus assembly chaperone PapD [Klebsiella sp. BIGb0407]|nr:P pilus assembly chaperone PapD [Klebsiella sp. BIGb0407]